MKRLLSLLSFFLILLGMYPATFAAVAEANSQTGAIPGSEQAFQGYDELDTTDRSSIYDAVYLPNDFFDSSARSSPIHETEPNNSFATANTIYNDCDVYGSIGSYRDEDYLKVTFDDPGTMNFFITCSSNAANSIYYQIMVYDSAQKLLKFTTSTSGKVLTLNLSAGTYYIKVYGMYEGETYYNSKETYYFKCKRYATASLDVPLYVQESRFTCGPASMRMILSYFGIYKSEDTIKNKANQLAPGDDYTFVYAQSRTLNYYLNEANIPAEYTYKKFLGTEFSSYQDQILSSLCTDGPVEVLLKIQGSTYFDYNSDGHYLVVKQLLFDGYNYIATLNDPHFDYCKTVTLPASALFELTLARSGHIVYLK